MIIQIQSIQNCLVHIDVTIGSKPACKIYILDVFCQCQVFLEKSVICLVGNRVAGQAFPHSILSTGNCSLCLKHEQPSEVRNPCIFDIIIRVVYHTIFLKIFFSSPKNKLDASIIQFSITISKELVNLTSENDILGLPSFFKEISV